MEISKTTLSEILQFYLQDMEIEDKIMNCILERERELY